MLAITNFQVGDRVRVTSFPNKKSEWIGKTGWIKAIDRSSRITEFQLEMDDNGGQLWISERWIELLEDEPVAEDSGLEFQLGDRVRGESPQGKNIEGIVKAVGRKYLRLTTGDILLVETVTMLELGAEAPNEAEPHEEPERKLQKGDRVSHQTIPGVGLVKQILRRGMVQVEFPGISDGDSKVPATTLTLVLDDEPKDEGPDLKVGDRVRIIRGCCIGLESVVTAINPDLKHSIQLETGKGRFPPGMLEKLSLEPQGDEHKTAAVEVFSGEFGQSYEAEARSVADEADETIEFSLHGLRIWVEVTRWGGDSYSLGFNGPVSPTGYHSTFDSKADLDSLKALAENLYETALPKDADGNPIFDKDICEVLKGKGKGFQGTINGCVFEGKMSFLPDLQVSAKPANLRRVQQGEKSLEILGDLSAGAIATITPPEVLTAEIIPSDPAERLAQLEGEVLEGMKLMEEGKNKIWQAVATIRSENLWEPTGHKSFKDYVQTRFGWKESYAHEIASAGETAAQLLDSGVPESALPESAAAYRPLKNLSPEQAASALTRAAEVSEGKPTARVVKAVVAEIQGNAVEPAAPIECGPSITPADFDAEKRASRNVFSTGCHACQHRRLAGSGDRYWCAEGRFEDTLLLRDNWALMEGCNSLAGWAVEPQPAYDVPKGVCKLQACAEGWEMFGLTLSDERYCKLASYARAHHGGSALEALLALVDALPEVNP